MLKFLIIVNGLNIITSIALGIRAISATDYSLAIITLLAIGLSTFVGVLCLRRVSC